MNSELSIIQSTLSTDTHARKHTGTSAAPDTRALQMTWINRLYELQSHGSGIEVVVQGVKLSPARLTSYEDIGPAHFPGIGKDIPTLAHEG